MKKQTDEEHLNQSDESEIRAVAQKENQFSDDAAEVSDTNENNTEGHEASEEPDENLQPAVDEEVISEIENAPETPTILQGLEWPESWETEFRTTFGDEKTDKLLKVLNAPAGPHRLDDKLKEVIAQIEANLPCFST